MNIKVGDTAETLKRITEADIEVFAQVTGDRNPIHLDDAFASKSRFGKRIAHGMMTASLISAVIANKLPGEGSIYLGQSLLFLAPVFPGDDVTARVTVKEVREDKPIVKLETVCVNQRDEVVVRGEATVLVSE